MSELETFQEHFEIADQLVEVASKNDLAECIQLLAVNLAHYEIKYGPLSFANTLEALQSEKPIQEQIVMINKGMEKMILLLHHYVEGVSEKQTSEIH